MKPSKRPATLPQERRTTPRPNRRSPLPVRHAKFVQDVLKGMSAMRAYLVQYPDVAEASAKTTGPRLLRSAAVANAVFEALEARAKKQEATVELIKERFTAIALAVDDAGNPVVDPNAMRALEFLGRHLGMITDRLKIVDEPPPLMTWLITTEELQVWTRISKKMAGIAENTPLPAGWLTEGSGGD